MKKSTLADRGFIARPELSPHLQFHRIDKNQALLVSETFNTLLHGELNCRLIPLLDGNRTQGGIISALKGICAESEILGALYALSAKGYIVSAEHGLDRRQAAYWTSLGATPRWAERRLSSMHVEIAGDQCGFDRHLAASGVSVSSRDAALTLVVCANYLETRLAEVNRDQLEEAKSWALVKPFGLEPMVGPVFRADRTGPCWDCLASRMRCHQEVHEFLRGFGGEDSAFRPFAGQPAVLESVYGLIAAEIAKWIVLQEDAVIHDHVAAVNVGDLAGSRHRVMRRPQCLSCGDNSLNRPDRQPLPLHLNSSAKTGANSSGSRAVPPEVTLSKYRHLVSRVSGVVTWLTRTTDDADPWLHVFWAGSNLGLKINSLSSLRRGLRSKSAGKGNSRAQSEVSALCEAVERYSGGRLGEEISVRKRLIDFAEDDQAIHPNDVQLFSDSQLRDAGSINAEGHPYNFVPPRVAPETELDWTPVWSFTQSRHRYLPTSMLYMTAPERRGPEDLIADTNGCAAGNSLEEAILQGFLELVERDAFAIWWYNRLRVPAVNLSGFDDGFLAAAPGYYGRHDRDIWLLDITSDFGIPTFAAVSRRLSHETEDIIYGAGSHLDSRIAATRAVCELNQCLTWLPRPGEGVGKPTIDDPMALAWWKTGRLKDCPWLAPAEDEAAKDRNCFVSDDLREEVEYCRSLAEERNLEFLVLDQTRPDIGLPVVRVIVPGMRHFWARFAPGRLYDVPVSMGFRGNPLDESQLNTIPVVS